MIAPSSVAAATGRKLASSSEIAAAKRSAELAHAYARRIEARFDAAQTTNENTRHWSNADGLGPNSALDAGTRRTLRNRSRYEAANDTYTNGMVSTLANDTVGTGPSLQMLGDNKKSDLQVENAFWRWMQRVKLPQKLRTMRRSKAVDGETFASLFTNLRFPSSDVQLDIRLHEADQIATPYGGVKPFTLTDGIILDDYGNVIGYSLLKEHPGESYQLYSSESELVPARNMIHLFNADRPGQCRGVPEIAPALPLCAWRRRYSLAVLSSAENAALLSWLLKTQAPPDTGVQTCAPFDAIETERGMGITLPAGWEMQQLKAEQPTTQFDAFQKAIIREMARCLNMPFNVAAGDSSSYNYASGRMDYQVYWKAIGVERAMIESAALDVLFAAWWAEARTRIGILPRGYMKLDAPPAHEWRWDAREHVDPAKEANAQDQRLQNGTTNRAIEVSKENRDIDELDMIAARTYGVTVEEYRRTLFESRFGVKLADKTPSAQQGDANAA